MAGADNNFTQQQTKNVDETKSFDEHETKRLQAILETARTNNIHMEKIMICELS